MVGCGEVEGVTSIIVISEIIHKLMFSEIIEKYGTRPQTVLRKMKNDPEIIASLRKYRDVISKVGTIGIKVLPCSDRTHEKASSFISEYRLMSNDAINAVLAEEHGIKHIATNDGDFERVDFLKVWKP